MDEILSLAPLTATTIITDCLSSTRDTLYTCKGQTARHFLLSLKLVRKTTKNMVENWKWDFRAGESWTWTWKQSGTNQSLAGSSLGHRPQDTRRTCVGRISHTHAFRLADSAGICNEDSTAIWFPNIMTFLVLVMFLLPVSLRVISEYLVWYSQAICLILSVSHWKKIWKWTALCIKWLQVGGRLFYLRLTPWLRFRLDFRGNLEAKK